ncbi:MAG: xanthine dehydrogenase family protein subunit M [Pseudomonadota bacterium]
MSPFEYRRPRSVAEAAAWLREDPEAKLLAGGQSLLAAVKLRFAAPSLLIDLQGLPDLTALREEDGDLWIGAMCTHASVAASPLVRRMVPMLADLAHGIGDQQVRNRGTLGGSISNADPAACWPAGVLALNGMVCTDRREIAADDFFAGLFTTALEPDEIVCGVRFPRVRQAHYLKFEQAASRFALTGVAVARLPQGARVVVTGLGSGIWRWEAAEQALARSFAPRALEGLAVDAGLASGDIHASAEFRAHLAAVLTRRAVQHLLDTAANQAAPQTENP